MCTPTLEPSVDRLHDIGPRQGIARGQPSALDHHALRRRAGRRGEDVARHRLVHGERRGEHAGMGVGHGQHFEHALDAAVLAVAAVQGVEHHVRAAPAAGAGNRPATRRSRFTSYSMTSWPPSRRPSAQALPLTSETSRSGDQPPIRTATRSCAASSCRQGTPMRRISHSSVTPLLSSTRRRTSSPSASRSAAVASPVLIRKLQCFSETCAPPRARPRQPARVDQLPGLVAGRIAEGRAAGAARTGCDSARARRRISAMRAAIASRLAGLGAQPGAR